MKLKFFTILLAVMFLVSACSSNNDSRTVDILANDTGRFVETEITPPTDGWFMTLLSNDGAIVAFDTGFATRFDYNGNGWTQSNGPGHNSERFQNSQAATFLQNGNLLVHVQDEGFFSVAADGTSTRFAVPEIDDIVAEGGIATVSLLQTVEDDKILIRYSAISAEPLNSMFTERAGPGNSRGEARQRFQVSDANDETNDETNDSNGHNNSETPRTNMRQERQTVQSVQVQNVHGGGRQGQGAARMERGQRGGMPFFGGNMTTSLFSCSTGEKLEDVQTENIVAANSRGMYALNGLNLLRYADGDAEHLIDGAAYSFA